MILIATLLIAFGLVVALLGLQLFKLLLPLLGFVSGAIAGFVGVQAVFGSGVIGSAMAIIVALMLGVLLAILSFAFFDLAVIIFSAMVGASALSYLGITLGLSGEGFIVFLLGLAGAIIAAVVASRYPVGIDMVVVLTALIGSAYVLTGLMLVAGSVTLDDLNSTGVVPTLLRVVDQSFLWFFVWLGGALLAMRVQHRVALLSLMTHAYAYEENKVTKK